MARFAQLLQNHVLWATLASWVIAQSLKMLWAARRQGRGGLRWFFKTGGMPSGHSAGATCLATGVGLEMGFHSSSFAVATIFALVTMFDAQGVRRSVGRQTVILNKIIDEMYVKGQVSEERLKELLGHTPIEVVAGALLGCLVALLLCR